MMNRVQKCWPWRALASVIFLGSVLLPAQAFAGDPVIDTLMQRLESTGATGALSSKDFCARCRCCIESGATFDWSQAQQYEGTVLQNNWMAITKPDVEGLITLRQQRLNPDKKSIDVFTFLGSRKDICDRCECCDQELKFDWSRFKQGKTNIDEVKKNWRLIPRPEFDASMQRIFE